MGKIRQTLMGSAMFEGFYLHPLDRMQVVRIPVRQFGLKTGQIVVVRKGDTSE